jgi:hypothetical protein
MSSWDNETPPKDTRLLPEGWRGFTVVSGDDKPSKAGNPMFTIQIKDEQMGVTANVFLMRTPGKRWFLKQVLEAIGVDKSEDENFNYLPKMIGKQVMGEVVHEPNKYINREGIEVETTQHRIASFKTYTANPDGVTDAADIAWKE